MTTPEPPEQPTSVAIQRLPSLSQFSHIPAAIWELEWNPTQTSNPAAIVAVTLTEDVFEAASRGRVTHSLRVCGPSLEDLAAILRQKIVAAADADDFTSILAPHRIFSM